RGQSLLDVTLAATTTISDLLNELRSRVAALADVADPQTEAAINADIKALSAQVVRAAKAASYDGVNLIDPGLVTTEIPVSGGPAPNIAFDVPTGRDNNLISVSYTLTGISSSQLSVYGAPQIQSGDGTYSY